MATRTPAFVQRGGVGARDVIVTYTGLLNGDDGAWASYPGFALRAYSVQGTFGVGGSVSLKASNNDALASGFVPGAQGDESIIGAAMTTAQTVASGLYTAVASYRPVVTAGDGTTNLTVKLYLVQD